MLTIYHSPMTRSCRVIWLAEELGLQYELKTYELFSEEMAAPEFLAIHPLGKVPAIRDGDLVLWETLAIMEYLIARYSDGALLPPRDTVTGATAIQWMEFGENQLTVLASEVVVHDGFLPAERTIPALIDRGRAELPKVIGIVEKVLDGRQYIAGDQFTAADIILGFALPIAAHAGFLGDDTPRCSAYLKRLSSRPAYQKATSL
ncbi:MAG: glutathione S-transferase [Halioglobus sp.]